MLSRPQPPDRLPEVLPAFRTLKPDLMEIDASHPGGASNLNTCVELRGGERLIAFTSAPDWTAGLDRSVIWRVVGARLFAAAEAIASLVPAPRKIRHYDAGRP